MKYETRMTRYEHENTAHRELEKWYKYIQQESETIVKQLHNSQ